ncbi:MAG: NUDIX hydrolase [Bacteroidetes bacterium]|nr:NUDIX hydrolase [Bacteroidota bacterium]
MQQSNILDQVFRLKAIAEIGLLYSTNGYDRERYEELQQISYQMLQQVSSHDEATLKQYFPLAKDYPTAKVDIRGMIITDENKIVMVKESLDGKWSIPGGWADVGYSPKEVIIKECKEETGLDVEVLSLLAVFDKKKHPHPPQPHYAYKMVFHCRALSSAIIKGHDVLEVGFFNIHALPELSEERILKNQLELLYERVMRGEKDTYIE